MSAGSIPGASEITPLDQPNRSLGFVDESGRLTAEGHDLLRQWRDFISGTGRIIPCEVAMDTNVITLSPKTAGPGLSGYRDFDFFVGVATATSTGSVTGLVSLPTGDLATLKVYKSGGASQAGSGDIVSGSLYIFVYADHLDSGAGGLIAK